MRAAALRVPATVAFVLALLLPGGAACAKDITVLCSTGLQSTLEALREPYEAGSGDKLVPTFDTSNLLKARLDAGAPFDVAVLTPALIAELVKEGRIPEDSVRTVARAGLGLAVAAGAPRPDISTLDTFRTALLEAPSIAYTTTGQSGQAFTAAVEAMGLADVVRAKAHTVPAGPAGALVAHGEAAMAVQLMPELKAVPGIDVVGPLPPEAQSYIVLTAGIGAASPDPARAAALLRFLASPEAAAVMRQKGLEPG